MGLETSRALWNRTALDLRSDEVLAQILDRGTMEDWRALYRLARESPDLRRRILNLIDTVPLPLPGFWRASLAALGEEVDWSVRPPSYGEDGI